MIEKMEEKLTTLFNIKINRDEETQKLTQLRDFLLPMLMNGQVGVR